jgi:hypothetical protein
MAIVIYISKDGKNYDPNPVYNGTAASMQIAEALPNFLVYISKDGINFDPNPVYKGAAARMQIADLDKTGEKDVYISKDGVAHEPSPVYHGAAANFLVDSSAAIKPNKTIYVSKDGTTYESQPSYFGAAANILISFHKATPAIIHPAGQGISGFPVYQITSITAAETDPGSDPKNAIDGKASTAWEGKNWIQADIGGTGQIRSVALKLNGGPYTFGFSTSLDGVNFELGTLTSHVIRNEFDYFTFPNAVLARYIRIEAPNTHLSVRTLELLTLDPQENQLNAGGTPGGGQVVTGKPPEPPVAGTTVTGPYPATGKEIQTTQRGPTVRHYASGKPDDKTIEKNAKGIKARNHQFIVYVTVKTIEHDDTVSLKFGGTHMGTGWFDNTVGFKDGATGLGTEEKHPSADLYIVKGPKIGSILGKKLGVAGVYLADENKCELWTDLGDGWKKQVEGVDVGDFNPKASTFECQLRIDGFEDEPEIHTAVVQPIAPRT